MLLETKISKDDGYQKQQGEGGDIGARTEITSMATTNFVDHVDTLIVWTELNGTDMALSFQEAEGCTAIW